MADENKNLNEDVIPEGYQFNLSDFAVFLSVMKNPKAYRNVMSIILNEPDLKLAEVKVEEVVLNRKGKKAIRLDAWARSDDNRQFAVEMQNDTSSDDVTKRSRYYQSMVDTPILKSGKKTLYKMLPATVVVFITQEDIFHKDRAMYTFTERCSEIPELELGDGTTKIFLNMSSKNGEPALVSLLQYMKNTKMDNPAIVVKDRRLVELDNMVTEVLESEEWEAVEMNILDIGLARGEEIGIKRGEEIGIKRGMEKGIEKGMKKGMILGVEKGLVQGTENKTKTVIRNMLKRGIPDEDICAMAECDQAMIEEVRHTLELL